MEIQEYTPQEYMEMAHNAGEIEKLFDIKTRISIQRHEIEVCRLTIQELNSIEGEYRDMAEKMSRVRFQEMCEHYKKLDALLDEQKEQEG